MSSAGKSIFSHFLSVPFDAITLTEEAEGKTRSEFRYGSFRRVVALPTRIQNTEVKAEYKDCILHLTLPKAEAEKKK